MALLVWAELLAVIDQVSTSSLNSFGQISASLRHGLHQLLANGQQEFYAGFLVFTSQRMGYQWLIGALRDHLLSAPVTEARFP